MDFKGIAGRMKQQRQEAAKTAAVPTRTVDPVESFRIRARMIGVLLRDARLNAGRTLDDCARRVRVGVDQIECWELGDATPSLPQLEILAYYLEVPISHFWGKTTFEAHEIDPTAAQDDYIALRDRMIGALLRQARLDHGLTIEALAAAAELSVEQLAQYELGEVPIPLHELTVLAGVVKKNLPYFLEAGSRVGDWLAMREAWKTFTELPEEVRRFASNPLNGGYIEIAMMLSQMPADRLRKVGESMLNITL